MTEHESWRVRGPRIVAALEAYGQPCTVSDLSTLVDDGRVVHTTLLETLVTVGAVKRLPGHPRQYQAAPGTEVNWNSPGGARFSQASIADLERLALSGGVTGKKACRAIQHGRWSAWNRLEVLQLIRRTRDGKRIIAIEITPKGLALLHERGVDVPPAVSLARPFSAPVCALCGQPPSPFTGAIETGTDGAYHAVCRLQVRYEAGEHVEGFVQPEELEPTWAERLAAETSPVDEPIPDEVDVQALALSMLQQCAEIINREHDLAGEWKDMEARLARGAAELETLRRNLHEVQQENGQLRQAVADERAERLKLRVDLERWVNGKLVDPAAVKLAVKAIRAGG